MQGLKEYNTGDDDRRKMQEMLARFENENPPDDFLDESDSDEDTLEDRLLGLDLDRDTDQIWEKLTHKERKEFEDMIQDGRLGNLLELWEPYWTYKESLLVTEVDQQKVYAKNSPSLNKKISQFSQLIKGNGSQCIRYNVVNVLYGYAYVSRLFNGDYLDMASQAAQAVVDLSESLQTKNFNSVSESVQSCIDQLNKRVDEFGNSSEFSVAVIVDVENIIAGPSTTDATYYTLVALSDLHRIIRTARKEIDSGLNSCDKKKMKPHIINQLKNNRKTYFQCEKKVEYLLGWTSKYGSSLLSLIPEIQTLFCLKSTAMTSHQQALELVEKHLQHLKPDATTKTLVQEIPSVKTKIKKSVTFTENTDINGANDPLETSIDDLD
ncbi:zinc finger HIT domain-containing protein 2-like isoform X2 [Tubulanus polymorphus]